MKEMTMTHNVGVGPDKLILVIKKKKEREKEKKEFIEQVSFGDLQLDEQVYSRKFGKRGVVIKHTGETTYIEWEDGLISGYPSGTHIDIESIERVLVPKAIKKESYTTSYIPYILPYYYQNQPYSDKLVSGICAEIRPECSGVQPQYYNYPQELKTLGMKGGKMKEVQIKLGESVIVEVEEPELANLLEETGIDDIINYRFLKDINVVPLDQGQEDQPRMYWTPGINTPQPDSNIDRRSGTFRFRSPYITVASGIPKPLHSMILTSVDGIVEYLTVGKAEEYEIEEFIGYLINNPNKVLVYKMPGNMCLYVVNVPNEGFRMYVGELGKMIYGEMVVSKIPKEFYLNEIVNISKKNNIPLIDAILAIYYLYKTGQIEIVEEKKKRGKKFKSVSKKYPFKVRDWSNDIRTHYMDIDIPRRPMTFANVLQIVPKSREAGATYFGR